MFLCIDGVARFMLANRCFRPRIVWAYFGWTARLNWCAFLHAASAVSAAPLCCKARAVVIGDVCWQNERTHRDFAACEEMTARYKSLPTGSEKEALKAQISQLNMRIKVRNTLSQDMNFNLLPKQLSLDYGILHHHKPLS
jgi:hypothetical protein